MKKTISFAIIHFCIAFSLAYALTGDLLVGGLIALIEPSVNTVGFYFHEKIWSTTKLRQLASTNLKPKTLSFGIMHFHIAFGVSYLLTGSLLVSGLLTLLEPSLNTFAYYCHEKAWARRSLRNLATQSH